MNEKGFSTLLGLCYLLPMLFLTSAFFQLFAAGQQMELSSSDGVQAQYIAESALETALSILCSDLSLYDKMRQEARGQFITYKKELFTEDRRTDGHHLSSAVHFRYFNYDDSYFTLTAVGSFDAASKRITVYIKEKNHTLSITRWDYHEQRL